LETRDRDTGKFLQFTEQNCYKPTKKSSAFRQNPAPDLIGGADHEHPPVEPLARRMTTINPFFTRLARDA